MALEQYSVGAQGQLRNMKTAELGNSFSPDESCDMNRHAGLPYVLSQAVELLFLSFLMTFFSSGFIYVLKYVFFAVL